MKKFFDSFRKDARSGEADESDALRIITEEFIPQPHKVIAAFPSFFILENEKGEGIRVDKTEENKNWKVGDTIKH